MNKIISLYRDAKLKELEHAKDEAIIAIKCENETYAALRAAKKSIKNADKVISLRGFTFDKEVNARIDAVRKEMDENVTKLNTFISEVLMMVDAAPTSKDKMGVLRAYGIINAKNRLVK